MFATIAAASGAIWIIARLFYSIKKLRRESQVEDAEAQAKLDQIRNSQPPSSKK
jgi:hypothetical protein